jgi:putative sigma-54 modulation protein
MNAETPADISSKLNVQAVHLEMTDAMRSIIYEKFAVLLRHNEHIVRINLRLDQDQHKGNEHHYTATGHIEIGGPDLVASAEGRNAYEVLDQLVDKLDRHLERRHGKRKDRRNHPAPSEMNVDFPKANHPAAE